MEELFERWTGFILEAWRNATPVQYAQVLLAIVLLGWYIRRFWSD